MAYLDTDPRTLVQHTMRGDKDTFVIRPGETQVYADGTEVPHLEVLVYRNGTYRGYIEIHTHKVYDDSISVGVTSRLETLRTP